MSVCSAQAQACLIRVAVLDEDGAPAAGAGNLYVSGGLISLAVAPQVTTGRTITQDNGCGEPCLTLKQPDKIDWLNLTLTLCAPEPELLEMLDGGTIHNLSDETTGYGSPNAGAVGSGVADLSVELWEGIIVGGSIWGYGRYAYPRTRQWVRQAYTHGADPLAVVYNGIAVDPGDWGDGPGGDWDLLSDEAVTIGGYAVETQTLPTAACGASTLVLA
jgi:hypothetical protein